MLSISTFRPTAYWLFFLRISLMRTTNCRSHPASSLWSCLWVVLFLQFGNGLTAIGWVYERVEAFFFILAFVELSSRYFSPSLPFVSEEFNSIEDGYWSKPGTIIDLPCISSPNFPLRSTIQRPIIYHSHDIPPSRPQRILNFRSELSQHLHVLRLWQRSVRFRSLGMSNKSVSEWLSSQ